MTIKISELANLTAVYGNVIVPVVADVAGTLITVKGNLDQLGSYIVANTEANIVQANIGMLGYVNSVTSANITVSSNAPVSNSSTGTTGQIRYDNNYIYICIATNTWKRANISTW